MKKPISILITAHRAQYFLLECLDSIEAQTYFKDFNDYEILLGIDDCQETLKKALAYKHHYRNLRIFMMNSNKGTFITMNTLLSIFKYDHYLRFDADDIMMPNMVETLMGEEEGYGQVLCKFLNFEDGASPIHKKTTQYAGGTCLVKREVIKKLGGYLPWICGADTEFTWRLENYFPVKRVDKILFHRRIHPNSLTRHPSTGLNSLIRSSYKEMIMKEKNKGFPHPYVKIVTNTYREI